MLAMSSRAQAKKHQGAATMSDPNAQIEQWRVDAAQQWRDQLLANAADFAKLSTNDQRKIASTIVADARDTFRRRMVFGVICERQWPNFEWMSKKARIREFSGVVNAESETMAKTKRLCRGENCASIWPLGGAGVMSRQSIKAIDAHCELCNWDNAIPNCFPEERESWIKQRDKALAKFRRALARTTKEEFLNGRWGYTPMSKREAQWEAMRARAS